MLIATISNTRFFVLCFALLLLFSASAFAQVNVDFHHDEEPETPAPIVAKPQPDSSKEQSDENSEAEGSDDNEKSESADAFLKRYLKPMPEVEKMEEDEFLERTREIHKRPNGDNVLEFAMRVPKDWSDNASGAIANTFISGNLFQDVSSYYSKASYNGRARVVVSAMNMNSNLTVSQWYLNSLIEEGKTTEGLNIINDNEVESLIVELDDDRAYVVRSHIVGNGDKILKMSVYVPTPLYQDLRALQKKIVDSFHIKNTIARPAQELDSYRFLDIATVSYPKNWEPFAKPMRSTERLEVSLANIKRAEILNDRRETVESVNTEGKVDVIIVSSLSDTSILDEIDNYKIQLENEGVLVGEKLKDESTFEYNSDMSFTLTEIYEGVDTTSNVSTYEFWFTVMVGGNYFYFVTMLTPSRSENFSTWANNTQAYRIMVKNLEPISGAYLIRN